MNMVFLESSPRELVRVNSDGSIVFAKDLTIEEAKHVIIQLVSVLKNKEDQEKSKTSTNSIFTPVQRRKFTCV